MFVVLLRWNLTYTWGLWKSGTRMDRELMYLVFRNKGQGPITHELKFLDRFCYTMLPCPVLVLSGKDEFKIFQLCMYFSSDRAAWGARVRSPDSSSSFLFLLRNIDCRYSFEPPHWGSSNEYTQSMFWAEMWRYQIFFVWKVSVFEGEIYIWICVFS